MPITVDAVYAGGVLRPVEPLQLSEQEIVRITIEPVSGHESGARRTAGLLHWTGDAETLERLIMDPGLDPSEEP